MIDLATIRWRSVWLRLALVARRWGLARKLAFALTFGAIASGTATYITLSRGQFTGADPFTVLVLLILDLILLLALGAVVARGIVGLWFERRRGGKGSRLHVRMVVMFSLVAVTPAILVAVFSALFFNLGLEAWFSQRVRTAVMESYAVARAYVEEHQQVIGGDALAMANDISRESMLSPSQQRLNAIVSTQAAVRSLTEAVVFDSGGHVLASSGFAYTLQLSIDQIPLWAYERARHGEVAILTADKDDRVRALVRIEGGLTDTYLYVGRFVDPKVIGHMERAAQAVSEYERMEGRRSHMEITFSMIFVVVALLLLLAAVWVGLLLATQLAQPIIRLIDAAELVRGGDLTVRVPERQAGDELASLSRAFNRMTSQLSSQRQDLVDANQQLDERRRFTEAVLSGLTAGVVGLDADGRIHLPNRSASELLAVDMEAAVGRQLDDVVPEAAALFEAVRRRPERLQQGEIQLVRDGRPHTLLVRLVAERQDSDVRGYVVTFDDVTELLSAQRKATWADIARRIAHEIKNPLTPIQLSAERLKRKYLKEITSDPETFANCTDTIIRHVGDIGRMVDEFSSFARMPAPVLEAADLRAPVRQAVFLQTQGTERVKFKLDEPDQPVVVVCDVRQVNQAVTNLLKNAVEAIQGRDRTAAPGLVRVRLSQLPDRVVVAVEDNGRGLPHELLDRLTEPYVTTRTKGTGLGLAIVKKIMEDHGGELTLEDMDGIGARISFDLPGRRSCAGFRATGGE